MTIKDKMLNSAKLMALSTELKSLETGTLRTLYGQLFLACEVEGVDIKSFAHEESAQIVDTRNKITELNTLKPDVTGDSVQSKAIAAAETAQRKVKEQGLKSELEKQQSEAGKKLYGKFKGNAFSSVKAVEIVAKIDIGEKKKADLNDKIKSVTNDLPWYLQNPKHTAIGVAVLLCLLFGAYKFYGWYNDPVRVTHRYLAKSENDRAQREKDFAKKNEVEQLNADAKAKEKAEVDAKQAKSAADQRLGIIGKAFSRFSDPASLIVLDTHSLEGFQITLKGKGAKEIIGMLNAKQYARLVGVLNGVEYQEGDVPTMESIKDALGKLVHFDFKLFVTTPGGGILNAEGVKGKPVMAIAFATDSSLSVDLIANWKSDPDGRGFYNDWQIRSGITVVTACDPDKLFERVRAIRNECENRRSDFQKKVELGEMDEEKIRPEIDKFLKIQVENLRKWLLEQ
ncbi:MAG: hypothetical protein D0530_00575 [Methylococcales bacterium]|nr:MAG: hypothetical protein D0530_00575 [Methylococcales bacterium]